MTGYVLILVSSGYSGLTYITFDVILKEFSHDVVVASDENGTVKGDDDSSVLTVSFSEALEHLEDYIGFVVLGSSDSDAFTSLISDANSKGIPIAVADSLVASLPHLTNSKVYTSDSLESFVENFSSEL